MKGGRTGTGTEREGRDARRNEEGKREKERNREKKGVPRRHYIYCPV